MDPIARWMRACPPRLADTLIAAFLTLVAVAGTAAQATPRGYRHADGLAYTLAAIAGIALLARRRWPVAVFATTLLAMMVFAARGYPGGPALLTVLVSVYTAASLDTRVRSLFLGVIAGLGLSVTRLIFTSETIRSTTVNALAWIGAALFLGWAVANRRAFVAEIRHRAERAELTREQEAGRRVDAERLRIARELHDVIAHGISAINVQAGVAAHLIDSQPRQAGQALQTIKALSKDAISELREVLNLLRAVDAPDPRHPTARLAQLEALIARTRNAGIPVVIELDGEPRALPVTVDLAAYRIIQEALTNVLRHAGGAPATVSLAYEPDRLTVQVNDDGPPSSPHDGSQPGGGYGLIGMRERAESLGGTFDAGRLPAGGFRVTAILPLAGDRP
jgi:signal transduction histidine kinase